ncbi:MAG TPA: VOC family protein [Myxococcota bacterium]
MIDHLGLRSTDVARTIAFLEKALAPLGHTKQIDMPEHNVAAFGPSPQAAQLWVGPSTSPSPVHLALSAKTRAEVDAFYAAAIAAGAKDNGKPGVRPHYHAGYYGAFVIDVDGNNLEAVCHAPA